MDNKPQKSPHLHVRSVDGLLFPEAIAITGNATALIKLRAQIDRALRDKESYPFSEVLTPLAVSSVTLGQDEPVGP